MYFIKNVGNNQLIDIPNSNYNTGIFPITYTPLYNGNQRFIFSKQFDDTYRIKCLFSQDYLFRVEDDTYLENKRLVLSTEEYSTTKILSDKFSLERYGQTNKFFIKTESSYGDKGLCVQNKDSSTGSQIVQATIPSVPDYINYYLWEFVKTDSINIHCPELDSMSTGGVKTFNLRVPYSVPYIISNDGTSSYMELYNNGNKIYTTGVGVRTFEYNLVKNTDYQLKVINTSSSQQITTKLEPKNAAFMYGMFDYGNQNYDGATPLLDSRGYYENAGMYPIVFNNLGVERVTMPNDGGWTPINSKYVVINTHGTEGAIHLYDGLSDDNDTILATQLPNDLSNVEMFILFSCYGANNLPETTTSMIEEAVRRGAKYALGFKDILSGPQYEIYLEHLSINISLGYSGEYLIYKSYDDMQQVLYENVLLNKIPYFFYKEEEGNKMKYYYSTPIVWPSNKYDGDTDELISYGGRNKSLENVREGNKYIISFYEEVKELLVGENFYTNIYYNDNNKDQYLNQIKQLILQIHKKEEDSFLFIIKNEEQYDIIEVNYNAQSLSKAFYNHSKNEYISFALYKNMKTNFVK